MKALFVFIATSISLGIASTSVHAHGDKHQAKKPTTAPMLEEKAFGISGDAKKVSRTVKIGMADTMRYSPSEITVKVGETLRIEAKNAGKTMHEIVIGTLKELKEHSALMKKFPSMEHDEPYMAHVGPGKIQSIVWQFTKPGEFYYACLLPGHFEAGMVGKIIVK
jgi:uncharacterized cupredoxin-like copper-binding protein